MGRLHGWLLRLGVSVLALWLVSRQVPASALALHLWQLPGSVLAACLLLLVPNLGFQFLKWRALLHSLPSPPPDRLIAESLLLGMLGGLLTPARVGEHGRVLVLPAGPGGSRVHLAGLSLLDRLVSSLVTVLAGGACLLLLPSGWLPEPLGAAVSVYAALSALAHLAVLLLLIRPRWVLAPFARWAWLARQARWQGLREGLEALRPAQRLAALGWGLAFWACFILQFSLLVTGLGFGDPRVPAAAGGTFLLTALFPFSLGDLGLRELFSGVLFSTLGADPARVVTASLVLFGINVLLPALVALPLLLKADPRTVPPSAMPAEPDGPDA